MKIEQTKCDHCGKLHDTPDRLFGRHHDLVRVYGLPGESDDFCDENCLREHLVARAQQKAVSA